jgi:hypothetical protein
MKVFVEQMPLGWARIRFRKEHQTIELIIDSDAVKNLYNDLTSLLNRSPLSRPVTDEAVVHSENP